MKPALIIVAGGVWAWTAAASAQSVTELRAAREHARASVIAYRAHDWSTTEARLADALKIQPHHPVWLYNFACAAALRGNHERALSLLDTLAVLGFSFDADSDTDFAALRASAQFRARAAALAANSTRVGASAPALALPDPAFLPEGIAYDPGTHAIYLSSVHQRKIVRVTNGSATTLADSSDGLWSVLGMAYSKHHKSIWAVSTVVPEMAGYRAGAEGTALIELDASSGSVRRRLVPPGAHHAFNDLTVDDETGVVYVSDPGTSSIFAWSEHGGWRELVPPGHIYNPSGLAIMPKSDWLYVADYSVGLVRVSRATGAVERVGEGSGISTYGTDGLMQYRGDLIIIQNAVQPHRVARLKLDAAGKRVVGLMVLERAGPDFDEPTLGVIAGQAVLYVANSRWGKFRNGAYVGPADAKGPVVLRLPLE